MRTIANTFCIAVVLTASLFASSPVPQSYTDCVNDQMQKNRESAQEAQKICKFKSMIADYKKSKRENSREVQDKIASHSHKDHAVDEETHESHLIKRQSAATLMPTLNQNKETIKNGEAVGPCANAPEPESGDAKMVAVDGLGDVLCKIEETMEKRAEYLPLTHLPESDHKMDRGGDSEDTRDGDGQILKKRDFWSWLNKFTTPFAIMSGHYDEPIA